MELKEVRVSNFKSLKEVNVKLSKFNVVIGANATGKTNLIEFFKFLRKAILEQTRPQMPYLEWWSYKNIVWAGMEDLPIRVGLRFDAEGYDLTYEVVFSGAGGAFRVPSEKLFIRGLLSMEREGLFLRIKYDEDFIKSKYTTIERLLGTRRPRAFHKERITKVTPESLAEQEVELSSDYSFFLSSGSFGGWSATYSDDFDLVVVETFGRDQVEGPILVSPVREERRPAPAGRPEISRGPFFPGILTDISEVIRRYTLLRPISLREVRAPRLVRRESMLAEDAANLSNVLHTWLLDHGGKLPERIEAALSALFPKMRVGLELTPDGRVFIKVYENGVELHPPSISDGLYKILAILMAIESRPSLLAIDEIENSLHARTLEYLIDELRNSGTTVIITTHSAIVADIVRPEELLIAEKGPEGTTLNRIKKPEQVREKMKHLGITQSEMWLYGKLE